MRNFKSIFRWKTQNYDIRISTLQFTCLRRPEAVDRQEYYRQVPRCCVCEIKEKIVFNLERKNIFRSEAQLYLLW